MKKCLIIQLLLLIAISVVFCDTDLSLSKDDLYLEEKPDGGFHLYIRKKPGIESVLLADTTGDPQKKTASYTLRAMEYNSINGDEIRILDGKTIDKSNKIYSIVDSTPEKNDRFTLAFHLFIPYVAVYGYPWGDRMGKVQISDGTFLNVMTFSKKYADYSGLHFDNPFRVMVIQKPIGNNFINQAVKDFGDIAKEGGGKLVKTPGKEDLVAQIGVILDDAKGDTLELVLALDTTESMRDDIPYLQKELIPLLKKHTVKFKNFKIGLVLYRDYYDEYLTKTFPFETDLDSINLKIQSITVDGGRDMPEAVYEALYEAEKAFTWDAASKLIILIGDAPPHPVPVGKVTKEMVYAKASEIGITINTIILPQ